MKSTSNLRFSHFSGFKEQSTSSTNNIPITAITTKKSQRIKSRQQKEDIYTPTEKLLKEYLSLVTPLELASAIERFQPKVVLCKPCINRQNRDVLNRLELSQMLPRLEAVTEMKFVGIVLHKHLDGDRFYVRWRPFNVLDDEYVTCELAVSTKLVKTVSIAEMTVRQKQAVCEKILKRDVKTARSTTLFYLSELKTFPVTN